MVQSRPPRSLDVGQASSDPQGLATLALAYLASLRVRSYAERTIQVYECRLRAFLAWCAERSLNRPTEITLPIIERYQHYLAMVHRTPAGTTIGVAYQRQHLQSVWCSSVGWSAAAM
jgi:integrase/recombinase XerD